MITQAALPLALAFIMFAMGLTMDPGDFRLLATRPKAVAVGLAAKLILVPLGALAVILAWRPQGEFAVGMVLLAACPAGVTSALLTHLAGGRIALAAAVTALTSLAATITVPLLVNAGLSAFAGYGEAVSIPVGRMTLGIFLVDTVPLLLGLGLQRWRPVFAARLGRVARPVATALFALIVAGAFVSQRQALVEHVTDVVPAALALNLMAMGGAWVLAARFGLSLPDRIAAVMENGLQNSALGIFVAVTLLDSHTMMVPSIVYAFVMNLTAVAVIWAARRGHLARLCRLPQAY